MSLDKAAFDAVLKDVLAEGIDEGINNKNALKDVLKFQSSPFRGREIQKLAHVGRNRSPMFSGEDVEMREAGRQGYVRMFIDQKKLTARVRLTYEVMQDSTSSEGAWTSARKSEMQYIIDDIALRDEHALCSDGRGVYALVDESPSGTNLAVDAPGGITNDNFGNRFISVGDTIGAVDPASGQLRTTLHTVTGVSEDGLSIDVDSATHTGWAENDYIVQTASLTSDISGTSYERAWMGLMGLVDDGTYRRFYFGLDREAHDAYASYVVPNTGVISADLLQRVSDILDQKLGGVVNLMICHHSTRRNIIQLTEPDRRYTQGNLMRPDAGTVAFKQGDIPFGDVNVRAIRDFPLNVISFLDTVQGEFEQYQSEPGKWMDEDGQVLRMVGGGTGSAARDAYEAIYRVRKQYYLQNPGVCARLDGVTVDNVAIVRPAGM